MNYLLDTDTFSMIAKERSEPAARKLREVDEGSVSVSVITIGEVRFGLELNPVHVRTSQRIEAMLRVLRALPLPTAAASHYANLRTRLQRKGTPIGANDLWLAAHALSEDLTLVTANEREFQRVPKLRIENWLR